MLRKLTLIIPLALSMSVVSVLAVDEVTPVLELKSRVGEVRFDHKRHAILPGTRCKDCHHTDSGSKVQGCHGCHRPDSKFPRNTERAFHDSCIGCHKRVLAAGMTSGPVKRCSHCHRGARETK
jgi:hypothetical protein